jgi:hypothetical protein
MATISARGFERADDAEIAERFASLSDELRRRPATTGAGGEAGAMRGGDL